MSAPVPSEQPAAGDPPADPPRGVAPQVDSAVAGVDGSEPTLPEAARQRIVALAAVALPGLPA
ncbi:MAG TPA: hypothetical protein VFT95_02770, partial [Micromonosporaceae bacterium]|nr:hypothetical protein [Micromonosporaceae bacterium]